MFEDCTAIQMPQIEADFCAPDLNFGEIDMVYFGHAGQPLVDPLDLAEWNARLDNTTENDLTKIRFMNVIGDKPLPEQTEVAFSKNRKVYTEAKHTINVRTEETGPLNYGLIQFFETNRGAQFPIWFSNKKWMYGGTTGIPCSVLLGLVIPESREELTNISGTLKFDGNHPTRTLNPLA